MRYLLVFLLAFISANHAFAQDTAKACPITMDGKQFYDAGGRLKLKSNSSPICPICVAKGTCGDGQIIVQGTVLADGSQTEISIVTNTYNQDSQKETSEAALTQVSQMTYEPPTVEGKVVCVKRLIRVNWVRKPD